MAKTNVIAIDIAKNIFQVCSLSLSKSQKVGFNKTLRRGGITAFVAQQPATTIVMEACYTSHYWGRAFLDMGLKVKLIPAQFVKPFVRGHKSDRNDLILLSGIVAQ